MFDAFNSWLSSLTPTTFLPAYTALISTITALVLVLNFLKDRTKIIIKIKRDSDSALAIQNPLQEILLIQVINKGIKSVIINEVGVLVQKKKYINFVDMLQMFSIWRPMEEEIMGSVEWISIPGAVDSQALGVALILFNRLEETYKDIKEGKKLSLEQLKSLPTSKVISAYEELMKSYNSSTKVLTVKPYTVTATGQRFIGKKTKIQLGNLIKP
jgi:hypothetical protein